MSAPTVPSVPDTSRSDAGELLQLIRDLQSRVQRLEDRIGIEATSPVPLLPGETHEESTRPPLVATPSNAAGVIGKVFLAIAGAFVLRALAEYGVIPAALGAGIGIVYALVWLFLAARLPIDAKFATAAASATSVLIMIPLIWDASQKFKVLPSWISSTVRGIRDGQLDSVLEEGADICFRHRRRGGYPSGDRSDVRAPRSVAIHSSAADYCPCDGSGDMA